jgi:hypothetical protein
MLRTELAIATCKASLKNGWKPGEPLPKRLKILNWGEKQIAQGRRKKPGHFKSAEIQEKSGKFPVGSGGLVSVGVPRSASPREELRGFKSEVNCRPRYFNLALFSSQFILSSFPSTTATTATTATTGPRTGVKLASC